MEFETSENVNDKYELGNYDESKKIRYGNMSYGQLVFVFWLEILDQ